MKLEDGFEKSWGSTVVRMRVISRTHPYSAFGIFTMSLASKEILQNVSTTSVTLSFPK